MSFKRTPGWKVYRDQMSQLDHGDALWEPAPLNYFKRIQLGDVGYVRRGCFNLLFSAGKPLGERQLGVDVPLTFQPVDVGPIVNLQPRLPGCLSTNTVRETGASVEASICAVPMLEPGFSISFELSEKQGAALVTKYSTYREDIQREQIFEEYTRRHYDSWVAFVREGGHGNEIKPVLVTGVDMTRDFAMMSYLNNGVRLKSEFTALVPGVASASASAWGTWRTEGLVHTNCGPQLCLPPSSTQTTDVTSSGISHTGPISEDYNQCVFVRYYTMRKRPLLIPRVIKASAGPHDLGPGDRYNEEPPLGVSYDTGNTPVLLDDDGDYDMGSIATTDSDSDIVFRNTAIDESDDFDIFADYVFQNSDAASVLLHHRDIALLRKAAGNNNALTQLLEKQPRIIVDRDGVGGIQHNADTSTKIQSNSLLDTTPPVASPAPSEIEHESASQIVLPEYQLGSALASAGTLPSLISPKVVTAADALPFCASIIGGVLDRVRDVIQAEDISSFSAVGSDDISPSPTLVMCGGEHILKCMLKANFDQNAWNAEILAARIYQSLPIHPNIVTLYSTLETLSYLLFLLEYVPGQDLFYYLEESCDSYETESPPSSPAAKSLTPSTLGLLSSLNPDQLLSYNRLRLISSMFIQMCDAVAACHEVNCFHRDIKPESFIVTERWIGSPEGRQEQKILVKLKEFGLSTNDIESTDMDVGSAPYISYECRNNVAPTYSTRAADVWSLGIVLINMLYHYNPWTDTAEGACSSFELYRQDPTAFFLERFAGMTMPVARFLATRVFCLLGSTSDGSPRVSADEFGVWVKDLPAHFSVPDYPSAASISSVQDDLLALGLDPYKSPSLQAPANNTTPRCDSRSTSPPPPLAHRFSETKLVTILDNDDEGEACGEPREEEIQPYSHAWSGAEGYKRERRNYKGKDVQAEQAGLTLETLTKASRALLREINRTSKISGGERFTDPIPAVPPNTRGRLRSSFDDNSCGPGIQSHIGKWGDVEKRSVSPTPSIQSTRTSSSAFTKHSASTYATSFSSGNGHYLPHLSGQRAWMETIGAQDTISWEMGPTDMASPSPQNGVCIPQRRFGAGSKYNGLVLFFLEDGSYFPVNAALKMEYTGLVDRDARVLSEAGPTLMLRFEWPGYPSHPYILRTVDWRRQPRKILLSKLATAVAKLVRRLVNHLEGLEVDPEHSQWKVGSNGIRVEDIHLAALEQVTAGSWQARLFYKRSPDDRPPSP